MLCTHPDSTGALQIPYAVGAGLSLALFDKDLMSKLKGLAVDGWFLGVFS